MWHPLRAPDAPARRKVGQHVDSNISVRGVVEGKFQLAEEASTAAAAAGDGLSDSESEDDEEDVPRPTPAYARVVFDESAADDGEETRRTRGNEAARDLETDGDACNRGVKANPRGSGGESFARDVAMTTLEETRRTKRKADAERLADRMGSIGEKVLSVDRERRR